MPPAASFLERKLGKELCTIGTYFIALRMELAEEVVVPTSVSRGPLLPALAPTFVFGQRGLTIHCAERQRLRTEGDDIRLVSLDCFVAVLLAMTVFVCLGTFG